MIILTIKTDKSQAELSLYDSKNKLHTVTWQAHRELSNTIHKKIIEVLNKSNKTLKDIKGIVCYKGPGSFTGLRIGLTVANALAYSRSIPIVARSKEQWAQEGIVDLLSGKEDKVALPEYGAAVKITEARK